MAFDVEKLSGKLTGALFEKYQNMNHTVFRMGGLFFFDSVGYWYENLANPRSNVKIRNFHILHRGFSRLFPMIFHAIGNDKFIVIFDQHSQIKQNVQTKHVSHFQNIHFSTSTYKTFASLTK